MSSDDVVEAVLRGFKRGEEEFGVVARVILCCIRSVLIVEQQTNNHRNRLPERQFVLG